MTIIRDQLKQYANPSKAANPLFFKTGPGEYAQHDQFLGISVPVLRTVARQFSDLPREEITLLLQSPYNEERSLALFILVLQYKKGSDATKRIIYDYYRAHIAHINNWNLVDASAHEIIGAYLFHYTQDKNVLIRLAQSDNLWERRIAMIATLYFIRKSDVSWTYMIAQMLLNDAHDLIHKAVGWMLREAGKKNEKQLLTFLDKNAAHMPRTMLRYALEKLSPTLRAQYMNRL
jgi:3-methyladenine DNA glycosylase AlkD